MAHIEKKPGNERYHDAGRDKLLAELSLYDKETNTTGQAGDAPGLHPELRHLSPERIMDLFDRDFQSYHGGAPLSPKEKAVVKVLHDTFPDWLETIPVDVLSGPVSLKTEPWFAHIRTGFRQQLGADLGSFLTCPIKLTDDAFVDKAIGSAKTPTYSYEVNRGQFFAGSAYAADGNLVFQYQLKKPIEIPNPHVHLIVATRDESALFGLRHLHEGKYSIAGHRISEDSTQGFAIPISIAQLLERARPEPAQGIYAHLSDPFAV